MTDIFTFIGIGVFALFISAVFILLFAAIKEDLTFTNIDEDSLLFGCIVYVLLLCLLVIPLCCADIKYHPEKYGIQFIDEQDAESEE